MAQQVPPYPALPKAYSANAGSLLQFDMDLNRALTDYLGKMARRANDALQVNGDATLNSLILTAGLTVGGTSTFNGPAIFNNSPTLFVSTDPGAAAGPIINLDRDSASPAISDVIGTLQFRGRDSGGAQQTYAQIYTVIGDPTAGTEDATLVLATSVNGAVVQTMQLYGNIMFLPQANADVEIGLFGSANSPFIDFHSGATGVNYDSRIQASSGSGADGGGTLDINANIVFLNQGHLQFPAVMNASVNANTLDDYEEGTWTPALSATGATFVYTSQSGTYTKAGRFVHLNWALALATAGNTLTGNAVSLTGLPFTQLSTNANICWQPVRWFASTTAFTNLYVRGSIASTTVVFEHRTAATAAGQTTTLANQLCHATNGTDLRSDFDFISA